MVLHLRPISQIKNLVFEEGAEMPCIEGLNGFLKQEPCHTSVSFKWASVFERSCRYKKKSSLDQIFRITVFKRIFYIPNIPNLKM
jgi:hypothetical protein